MSLSYEFLACGDRSTDEFVPVIKEKRDSYDGLIVTDITKKAPRFEDVKKLLYAGADYVVVEDEKIYQEVGEYLHSRTIRKRMTVFRKRYFGILMSCSRIIRKLPPRR